MTQEAQVLPRSCSHQLTPLVVSSDLKHNWTPSAVRQFSSKEQVGVRKPVRESDCNQGSTSVPAKPDKPRRHLRAMGIAKSLAILSRAFC